MEEVRPPASSDMRARPRPPRPRARLFPRLTVIPGWSEGPDLSCAIAHRGISRFRVRVFDAPRNDGEQRVHRTKILMPRIAPLLLALAGLILFGQGAYIHAKAMLAQVLLQRAFTETIATGHPTKPWPWADTWPVARIEVQRLHASTIVLAGSSGQALAFGPGHVELTPDAGARGVAVYSAHRDTHFRFLRDVAVGDEIDITRSDGRRFRYRADSTSVVRFDASGIDPLT